MKIDARLPFILLCASILASCNAMKYDESQLTGATARVRFATDSKLPAVLRVYADSSCQTNEKEWLRVWDGSPIRSQPKRLGIPLWTYKDAAAKEILISTNIDLNGMFFGADTVPFQVRSCAVPFSYHFLPAHDYEVLYHWAPDACTVTIAEIEILGNTPYKSRRASFDSHLNETTAPCMHAFDKKRLY